MTYKPCRTNFRIRRLRLSRSLLRQEARHPSPRIIRAFGECEEMLTKCPVCGAPYSLFDKIAQPPMCRSCFKSGARNPNYDRGFEESGNQTFIGTVLIVVAVGITALVLFVPSRQGAPRSGKFYLLGLALIALGKGLERIRSGREKARANRK